MWNNLGVTTEEKIIVTVIIAFILLFSGGIIFGAGMLFCWLFL